MVRVLRSLAVLGACIAGLVSGVWISTAQANNTRPVEYSPEDAVVSTRYIPERDTPTDAEADQWFLELTDSLGTDWAISHLSVFRAPDGREVWGCGYFLPRRPTQVFRFELFVVVRSLPGQFFRPGHPYFDQIAPTCWHPAQPRSWVIDVPPSTPLQPISIP